MKKIGQALLRWLFRIKLKNGDALKSLNRSVLFADGGTFWSAALLHFFLPEEYVFVLPKPLAGKISILAPGRRRISYNADTIEISPVLDCLADAKTVVVFPEAGADLLEFCQMITLIIEGYGSMACPLVISSTTQHGRLLPMPGIIICVGELLAIDNSQGDHSEEVSAQKVYGALQNTVFAARYQEQANLFDQLWAAAKQFGMGKVVAEDFSGTITYRTLIIGSYILGRKLGEQCPEESRLGLLLPTSIGHLITLFAVCYQGKTPAILNFSAGSRTVQECAELVEIQTIITARVFVEKAGLQQMVEDLASKYRIIYLEDLKASIKRTDKLSGLVKYVRQHTALSMQDYRIILFTSGSEQKPKGVVLRHTNILANVEQLACAVEFTAADKMLSALPMFHSFGLTGGIILPVLKGVEVFLYPSPLHYKVIPEIIVAKQVTMLLGTPTFLAGYAKNADEGAFQSLRFVLTGGEKLNNETRNYWQEKFHIHLLEAYGTTETSPGLCVSSHRFNKDGAVGKFLPGIDWRIEQIEGIDEGGKLWVKGPNIMEGYLIHGSGFVPAEEWYDCGDVVQIDQDGYCTIKARLKRFAKISGEMVSLNLVEEAAVQCFTTDQNAAVSVFDGIKGEKIVLFTTTETASRQQLRDYIKDQQLSMLLLPTELIVLEELPVLGSGKIDYVLLQEITKDRE